ncbi:MAG: rod shape-determining protein RodA, partial [Prevotellaceae bacterium]|nr:rod shape-determining protein RodA [Prevotellaceae bacterium]
MAANKKNTSILGSLDWWTVALYLCLLIFGWFSICGASYTYGETDFFSLDTRTGMQIIWIGTAICLAFVIMCTDSKFFDTFAFVIYGLLLLLLFATIFNPHE